MEEVRMHTPQSAEEFFFVALAESMSGSEEALTLFSERSETTQYP